MQSRSTRSGDQRAPKAVGSPCQLGGPWPGRRSRRGASRCRRWFRPTGVPPSTGWAELSEDRITTLFHPQIGTLGGALAESDVCATAVGPGAALALADPDGFVRRYFPVVSAEAFDCPLTVVDLGSSSVLDGMAAERLAVDAALEALLDQVPFGTDLVISSVSSPIAGPLALGVGLVATERSIGASTNGYLLTSPSTRWDGVVRLLDVPSTMTDALGVPEPALFNGSPIMLGAERPATATVVEDLAGLTSKDRVLRRASAWFVIALSTIALLLMIASAVALRRGRPERASGNRRSTVSPGCSRPGSSSSRPCRSRRTWSPWCRGGSRGLHSSRLWVAMVAIALVVGFVVQRLCRRSAEIWWPALAVSGLTVVVLIADALLGTPLHRLSPLGPSAITGGRYYGIGNSSFAVLGAHAVILCGALAARALARGRRTRAILIVAAIGTVTVLVDVGPTWGADLGGGAALVPAFVVLAILVSGTRMTWARGVATGAAAVAVLLVIGVLDWTRPAAQRSHAGRFVQSVIDGDAWETVTRKASFALATVINGPIAILTIAIFVTLVLWVRRPDRFAPLEVRTTFAAWPTLRSTCIALLVVLGVGALANDYGVRVITIGLAAALAAADRGDAGRGGTRAVDSRRSDSGRAGSCRPAGASPARRDRAATVRNAEVGMSRSRSIPVSTPMRSRR